MPTSSSLPGAAAPGHPPASKIRMLFVEDEPAVLGVLKIGMRPMAGEWDMHFVEDGEAALALIKQQPFDVVVSDMRMPGMNGAQLLNHVLQLHPRAVRIILSGYSDLQDVISSVGLVHQFLHKPCSLIDLRNCLKRIADLNRRLQQDELLTLAARLTHVPSVPGLYLEILQALQSPTASTQRIADIAARDPALSAKLLQLSNSAFFGSDRTVYSVAEAVQFLGVGMIQSLALAVPLFSAFDRNKCPAFSIERLWQHSVQTAILARWLVHEYLEDPSLAEQAFAAGILHDIGQIMLASGMSREYADVLAGIQSQPEPLCQAERKKFQATHAEMGGYLLALWGLPFSLVDAVAYHHEPGRSSVVTFGLAGIIHVANALQHEQAPHPDAAPCPLDTDYIRRFRLADPLEKWRNDLLAGVGPSLV